jgi:sarcosine oxidase, subunit gamma
VELGLPLPDEPDTVADAGELSLRWLAPDNWLVVGGCDEPRLRLAVGTKPAPVADVSAQRNTTWVAGLSKRELLAYSCSPTLHLSRFPAGRCAKTLLVQAPVILVPKPADEYWAVVCVSFAPHLADWLLDAAIESR